MIVDLHVVELDCCLVQKSAVTSNYLGIIFNSFADAVTSQREHHVPENIIHHPDCGGVRRVRPAHLLGDVWHRVH